MALSVVLWMLFLRILVPLLADSCRIAPRSLCTPTSAVLDIPFQPCTPLSFEQPITRSCEKGKGENLHILRCIMFSRAEFCLLMLIVQWNSFSRTLFPKHLLGYRKGFQCSMKVNRKTELAAVT